MSRGAGSSCTEELMAERTISNNVLVPRDLDSIEAEEALNRIKNQDLPVI